MPRFEITAHFDTVQADKDRASFFDRLKKDLKEIDDLGAGKGGGGGGLGGALGGGVKQAANDLTDLRSRLAAVKADLANMNRNGASPVNFQGSQRELDELLKTLNVLRAESERMGDLRGVQQYSNLIVQTTRELGNLQKAQTKALGKVAGDDPLIGKAGVQQVNGFIDAVKLLDAQMTNMEAHRAAGKGKLAEYRQELLNIRAAALNKANDTNLSDAERNLYANSAKRAGRLISDADTREADKLTLALTALKARLAENAVTSDRASAGFAKMAERARALAEAEGVGEKAALRFLKIQEQMQAEVTRLNGGAISPLTAAIRKFDDEMTKMEAHRAAGLGTLASYRESLLKIQREAQANAVNPAATGDERAGNLKAAKRAGTLINAADTQEANKLSAALAVLKTRLADGEMSADRAQTAFTRMTERTRQLAEAQGVSEGAARRYYQIIEQIRTASAAINGGDAGVEAAKAQARALTDLNTRWRANLIVTQDGTRANGRYRAELEAILAASKQEAQNTARSTEARREYARTAEQAANALKRLRSEEVNGSTGGSLPFALNSVAFGLGGLAAGGGAFLKDALELNEQTKMAALNLSATAKYYKLSGSELAESVDSTAKELRVSANTVAQATTFLVKAGFNPEMAAVAIKRFSDSAVSNALDANRAIINAAQGIQQGLSRTLNSAGIEENIGPEIQRIQRAMKKGESSFRLTFLRDDDARKYFDELRAGGRSFNEAADAAGRFQFLIKATNVDAGRTAQTLYTLTGSLNNFRTKQEEMKKGLLEGVSMVAVPAINIASGALDFFNNLPGWTKGVIGLAAGATVLTGSIFAASAGMLALALQTKKTLESEGVLALVQGRLSALNTTYATTAELMTMQMTKANVQARLMAANASIATVATNAWNVASRGLVATQALLAANPLTAALLALGVVIYGVTKAYDYHNKKVEEANAKQEEFWNTVRAEHGDEYAGKLYQLGIYQKLRLKYIEDEKNAATGDEKAIAQQRIKNVEQRIFAINRELTAIRKQQEVERGSMQATVAQAEAYRNLKTQLDAVAERYGDMKLSSFQKDLRAAQKEQKKLLDDIMKGQALYNSSEHQEGLTPDAAKKLTADANALVPNAIKGLTAREMDEARKSALQARAQMERDLNSMVKDGVAKRQALLKIETRTIQEEYGDRIRQARANRDSDVLKPDKDASAEENKRRAEARREFAALEQRLIAERNQRVSVLEKQAANDVLEIQRERDRKILDGMKEVAQQRVALLQGQAESMGQQRDRTLAAQDVQDRYRTEQAYYASTLKLAQDTARAQAGIRRGEALVEYRQALVDAANLGEHRGKAEANARLKYQNALKENEVQLANDLGKARTDADNRVFSARAALLNQITEFELRDIDKIEGKRLQALEDRYRRELRLAEQRGDSESASAMRDALKTVQDAIRSRALAANEAITEANKQIGDLSEKLNGLTAKAAKGVGAARQTAAQPFDDYLKSLRDERKKLDDALKKLPPVAVGQRKAIEQQLKGFDYLAEQAQAGRKVAVTRATQDFNQKEQDKLMQQRAKLAEKLYDNGEGDVAAYQAALQAERTYWTTRMKGMEKGSDEYEAAQTRIEELRQKSRDARLRQKEQPLEQARSALSLNEAQQAAAKTEAERNSLLAERLRLLQRVLELETARANNPELKRSEREAAKKNAQDAKNQILQTNVQQSNLAGDDARYQLGQLTAQRDLVKGDAARAEIDARRLQLAQRIAALDRQRAERGDLPLAEQRAAESRSLESQKQAKDLARGIRDEQVATTKSVQDLAAAQVDYTLAVGRSEAQITAAMGKRLVSTRSQIQLQDKLIAEAVKRGDPEASINALKVQRIQLQTQELSQARALAARPFELRERTLRMTEAENAYRAAVAMTNAESINARQAAIVASQNEIDLLSDRIAHSRSQGLTDAQVEELKQQRLQKQTDLYQKQRDLREALLGMGRAELGLLESQIRLRMARAGTDTDPIAAKQAELDAVRRQIGEKQREMVGATEAEQIQLQTEINGLLTDEIGKQRELVSLGFQRSDSYAAVVRAQHAYTAALAMTNEQVLAGKRQGVLDTQADIDRINARIAARAEQGLSEEQVNQLKEQRLQKQTELYQQQRDIREYLNQLDRDALTLLESQIRLQNTLNNVDLDPVESKRQEYAALQRQIDEKRGELTGATEADQNRLNGEINDLLTQQLVKRREIREAIFSVAKEEMALLESEEKLAAIRGGRDTDPTAAKQAELVSLRRELAERRLELETAVGAQRMTLQREINDLLGREIQAQRELVDLDLQRQESRIALTAAQHQHTAALAQTNAEVLAGKQQAIQDTQAEIAALETRISRAGELGLNEIQVDGLRVNLLQKQSELYQKQRDAREAMLQMDRDSLALLESQIALANAGNNDPIAQKRAEIDAGRTRMAQIASEMRKATEAERVRLQTELNKLLADEIKKQQELISLDFQRHQSAVSIQQAEARYELTLSAYADDAVAQARLEAALVRQNLQLKRDEFRVAQAAGKGEAEVNNIRAQAIDLARQVVESEKKVNEAIQQRADLMRELQTASEKLRSVTTGGKSLMDDLNARLNGDVYAKKIEAAERSIKSLRDGIRETIKANETLRHIATPEADAAIKFNQLQMTGMRENITAYEADIRIYEELTRKAAATRNAAVHAEVNGITKELLPALANEQAAREETARLANKYMNLYTTARYEPSTANQEKLKKGTEELTAAMEAQRQATQGVADAYRNVVSQMDNIRAATDSLKKTVYGDVSADIHAAVKSAADAAHKVQSAQDAYLKNPSKENASAVADAEKDAALAQEALEAARARVNVSRELSRLQAIEARRSQLILQAQDALTKGDRARASRTLQTLNDVEKRYQDQIQLLQDVGMNITPDNSRVAELIDQADRMGIAGDAMAADLERRAELMQQEAESVNFFATAVQDFKAAVDELREREPMTPPEPTPPPELAPYQMPRPYIGQAQQPPKKEEPNQAVIPTQLMKVGAVRDGKTYTVAEGGKELPAMKLVNSLDQLNEQFKNTTDPKERARLSTQVADTKRQLNEAEVQHQKDLGAATRRLLEEADKKNAPAQADPAAAAKNPAAAPQTDKDAAWNKFLDELRQRLKQEPQGAEPKTTTVTQPAVVRAEEIATGSGTGQNTTPTPTTSTVNHNNNSRVYNYGGIAVHVTTLRDTPNPAELAERVLEELQARTDMMGAQC